MKLFFCKKKWEEKKEEEIKSQLRMNERIEKNQNLTIERIMRHLIDFRANIFKCLKIELLCNNQVSTQRLVL